MSRSRSKIGSVEIQAATHYSEGEITDATEFRVFFAVLKNNDLFIFTQKQDVVAKLDPRDQICVSGSIVNPLSLIIFGGRQHYGVSVTSASGVVHNLFVDTPEEQQMWLASLLRAAVPTPWPAGAGSYYRGLPNQTIYTCQLPPLLEQPLFRRKELLLRKLQLCSVCFKFNPLEPAEFAAEKQYKRETLLELVDLCDTSVGPCAFNDFRTYSDVLKMLSLNLFRALPSKSCTGYEEIGNAEDDEGYRDPAWPHLSVVYELLLRLVQATKIDIVIKKKATSVKFLRKLLRLFDTEDSREREYLKTSTHRIYGKLTNRRAAIRRCVNNIFFEFLYETNRHFGISELLEILASIINGFAVPIKTEHKKMLTHALLPLHKMCGMAEYHPPLSYCMVLFCGKDRSLTTVIIQGLLRYWPCGNTGKEMLFLQELDELFEFMTVEEFAVVRKRLSLRLLKCIDCPHIQICERALWLWKNESFRNLTVHEATHRHEVLKIVFDGLYKCSQTHPHDGIRDQALDALSLYRAIDPEHCQHLEDTRCVRAEGILRDRNSRLETIRHLESNSYMADTVEQKAIVRPKLDTSEKVFNCTPPVPP